MTALFTQINLRARLLFAFLLVGILPFAIVSIISLNQSATELEKASYNQLEAVRSIKKAQIERYFQEREGDMGVLMETVAAIRAEAVDKLVAVRENKKKTATDYLRTIENQLMNMSSDPTTIQAVRDFSESFNQVSLENGSTEESLARGKADLQGYYLNQFGQEYVKQTGHDIQAKTILNQLSKEGIALQYHYIAANKYPFGNKHQLNRASDNSSWSRQHGRYHPRFRDVLEKFGYYDIFLVDTKGNVVYTVFKELDFATNLKTGAWKNTGLAKAWQTSLGLKAGESYTQDFSLYTPSYDAPAGFMAAPIFDGNQRVGSLIYQMPLDRITQTMSERAGLGETGETYLIGQDKLMRSDSYLDPANHTVVASFRHPEKGAVNTQAAEKALAGQTGVEVIVDYNGNPVISAYSPLKVAGLNWAILSEVDVAEAFVPKKDGTGKDYYQKYVEKYGYYDLFLMNPDGYVFYTAAKEADYQTNMVNGKFAASNLGDLTRKVLQTGKFGIADFAPYAPSNNEPAAFIAQPVIADGKVEMVVAMQLPLEGINSIMTNREGMGETGETYLIGQDKLMRSDSFLDPVNHTVKASFANPAKGIVETEAANAVVSGQTDSRIIIDYNGNPVLSSFTPVKVGALTWGLLAEIDEAEAFGAINALKTLMLLIAIVTIAAIVALALLVVRGITKPVSALVDTMAQVQATGDFKHRVVISTQDEIGQMAGAFNDLLANMQTAIAEANSVVGAVARGQFDKRITADLKGDLNTLKEGVNGSAQSVDFTMNELGKVMHAMYNGDFSVKMDAKVEGDFRRMVENTMNTMDATINGIISVMDKMREGKFQYRVTVEARGDLLKLKDGVNASMDVLEGAMKDITRVVVAQSDGDLTQTITNDYHGELRVLKEAINASAAKLNNTVAEILNVSESVAGASTEVSSGSMNLSQRTQEMAASLEETAASMEEMTATVKQNTDSANQANQLASQARNQAGEGGQIAAQAIEAMKTITESSQKIADIITLIDGIAFQTNLLALNAAVEAARAGEHGRGFAVVAGEVRSLAQKSAEASRDIKTLIESSVANVEHGSTFVAQTGEALESINGAVKKVSDIVSEIAAASAEQAQGIDQVNRAVMGLDSVTQQNAALVEETSAAAGSLSDQSSHLKDLMSFFKADNSNHEVGTIRMSDKTGKSSVKKVEATPKRTEAVKKPKAKDGDDWSEF